MATVYLAEDLRHHRKVAVKVLRPDLAASLGVERFNREITIAAALTYHILPLHDSSETEGFLYYVMPYVEGPTLRHRLVREGELPVAEAVRILRCRSPVTGCCCMAFFFSDGAILQHRPTPKEPRLVFISQGTIGKELSQLAVRATERPLPAPPIPPAAPGTCRTS